MSGKRLYLLLLSAVAAVAALAFGASTTTAGTKAPARAGAPLASGTTQIGNVNVTLKIGKFVKRGRNLVAVGTAVAHFAPTPANPAGLPPATTQQRFVARVVTLGRAASADRLSGAQRICPVLDLTLGPLDLNLLGLIVHLDRVHLRITADSRGGLLGRLFCSLSRGRLPLGQAAKRLTRVSRASGLATRGVRMDVPLFRSDSGAITAGRNVPNVICPVLDLGVGPLDLNLLGLLVHLDRVHLVITADSEGGILGQLLCSLAGGGGAVRTT